MRNSRFAVVIVAIILLMNIYVPAGGPESPSEPIQLEQTEHETVLSSETTWASEYDAWRFRKRHTIMYTLDDGPLIGYQINITVHFGDSAPSGDVYVDEECQDDFDDIRFAHDDGTVLPYWMESYTEEDQAVFWVKLKQDVSAGTQYIYMYYGNPYVETTSDGDATFLFFDDFEDDLSKWSWSGKDGADILETASCPSGGGDGDGLRYKEDSQGGSVMQVYAYWEKTALVKVNYDFYWDARKKQHRIAINDHVDGYPTFTHMAWGSDFRWRYMDPYGWDFYSEDPEAMQDQWHTMEFQAISTGGSDFVFDGEVYQGENRRVGDGFTKFRMYGHDDYSDEWYMDNFIVRMFTPNEPEQTVWTDVESSKIDVDIKIVYDSNAEDWYISHAGEPGWKQAMVEDVDRLNDVYGQYWSNIEFHVDVSWITEDENGWDDYDSQVHDYTDYYAGWQEELGWPTGMSHFGNLATGESGIHGRHFDYLVMFTGNNALSCLGTAGINGNAMLINAAAGITLRGWSQAFPSWPLFAYGISSVIGHEMGHTLGISGDPHPAYDDIMDTDSPYVPAGFQPASYSLSSENQETVEPNIFNLDEKFWYKDTTYFPLTSPRYHYMNYNEISTPYGPGHHVDTIGTSGDYGYQFFGYGFNVNPNSNGEIWGSGYFRQDDDFYGGLPEGRRFLRVYALEEGHVSQGTITTQIEILTHEDGTTWCLREFVLSGLDPTKNYVLGFGRGDAWSYDGWNLEAEWFQVVIYS